MQTAKIQAKGTRRIIRRSLTKQLFSRVDVFISRAEKWLVDGDRHIETAVRWFLAFVALYLVGQVVEVLFR